HEVGLRLSAPAGQPLQCAVFVLGEENLDASHVVCNLKTEIHTSISGSMAGFLRGSHSTSSGWPDGFRAPAGRRRCLVCYCARTQMRFARWLAEKPWIILSAALLLTLGLGFYAWQIRIESSFESVRPRHDPDVAYYEQIRRTFGSDDVAVVGLRTDDLFALATLEKVHRVTVALEKLEGVEGVLSLTNTPDIALNVFPRPPLLP